MIGQDNSTVADLRRQIVMVRNELVILSNAAGAARDQLTQHQRLTAQEQLQRQIVDAFLKLLSNPAAATDAQLYGFIEQILAVLCSRTVAAGLPVDYTKLKQEMQFLLEAVLGKQFVTRDFHEAQVKALRQQNSDLLLGGLITLRHKHVELKETKAELAEASAEKIITTLAEQNFDLEIVIFKCLDCRSMGSLYRPLGNRPGTLRCPACASGNLKLLRRMNTSPEQDRSHLNTQIEQKTQQINPK